MTLQSKLLDVDVSRHTVKTKYLDIGSGPVVLLLHGSGPGVSAQANWSRTIPHLMGRHRVIAPDLLGFGGTERPSGVEFGPASWVQHIVGLLDALRIDRYAIVGNSFGGSLALRLGLAHPERVKRQVLMGPVGISFPITDALDSAWGYNGSSEESMRAQLLDFASDPGLVTDDVVSARHAAAMEPGVLESYLQMFPPPRQQWVEALAFSAGELNSVTQETLIVHGREDRIIPLAASEKLVRLIPKAQLHVLGQCGHWVQIEQAQRFNELITNFLDETDKGAAA